MLRFKRFVPFAILLVAAVVALLVPQGRAHAETRFPGPHEAAALLPKAGACEITPTAQGSIPTTETAGPMLSCSVATIWSVWDMIDEECGGTGMASFTCNADGSLRTLALICLPW